MKQFLVYPWPVKTRVRSLQMQRLIAFHLEFRLDDAFLGIEVQPDIVVERVGVEDANEPNEVEAAVVGHDMLSAATVQQKVDRHSLDCHQLCLEKK